MFKLSLAVSAALVVGQVTVPVYCAALASKCPGHSMNSTQCEDAMATYVNDIGSVDDLDTDTLECRYKYLNSAAFNSSATRCQYAGPTGGGRCGAMLTTSCRVIVDICGSTPESPYTTTTACEGAAPGLMAQAVQFGTRYGANANPEDSLECRVYHAIAGILTQNKSFHCTHITGDAMSANNQCNARVAPNVDHYCDLIQKYCPADTTASNVGQFALDAQCRVTAAGYPSTLNVDDARATNAGNTLGCRHYHAQAASTSTIHCEHAGPSGAGACGSRQDAWASMLKAAPCLDPHVDMFISTVMNATIVDQIIPIGDINNDGNRYSTTFDTGADTQVCRIYHLGVASTAPFPVGAVIGHCQHGAVSGGGACGSIVNNLCRIVGLACGFGANRTWQFADDAACRTSMANASITLGTTKPQDISGNTHECRVYHAGVAASYLPGGQNGAGATAASERIRHCSHVIGTVTAAGGCGAPVAAAPTNAGTTPTAARAPTAAGSASTLSVVTSVVVLGVSMLSL